MKGPWVQVTPQNAACLQGDPCGQLQEGGGGQCWPRQLPALC